jgi:hypothetical protein
MAYIRLNPPKKTAKEDGWSSVKDFKETAIENSKSQLAEIHEETESMRQMMDELERDAPIPFTDIAFDNEDSAAGDFYLSIDAQGEEGEDE